MDDDRAAARGNCRIVLALSISTLASPLAEGPPGFIRGFRHAGRYTGGLGKLRKTLHSFEWSELCGDR